MSIGPSRNGVGVIAAPSCPPRFEYRTSSQLSLPLPRRLLGPERGGWVPFQIAIAERLAAARTDRRCPDIGAARPVKIAHRRPRARLARRIGPAFGPAPHRIEYADQIPALRGDRKRTRLTSSH